MRVPRWKRQTEIAEEVGEPFDQVIRGFREQGCNWETIAGAVEMPLGTLRKWVRELELGDGKYNHEIVRAKPLDLKAQSLGYESAEEMQVEWRMSGRTRGEVAEALGCHPTSLYWHTPEELKGVGQVRLFTEKQLEARRQWAIQTNRNRHGASRTNPTRTE